MRAEGEAAAAGGGERGGAWARGSWFLSFPGRIRDGQHWGSLPDPQKGASGREVTRVERWWLISLDPVSRVGQ